MSNDSDVTDESSIESSNNNVRSVDVSSEAIEGLEESSDSDARSTDTPVRVVEGSDEEYYADG